MLLRENLLQGKRKYLSGFILLLSISLICVAFTMSGSEDFDIARREVLLRKIGHELLLQSGDSTSRVLPVKKMAENEYRVSFENAFTFQPEVLVNTTQRVLANDPLAANYVVNVLNCADGSVAYGYAIAQNKKDDIITCKGRKQPVACYMLNIKFKPAAITTAKNGYLLGALLLLAVVGFIFLKPVKQQKILTDLPGEHDAPSPDVPASPDTDVFTLGTMVFDAEARKLMINGTAIELTKTETRVLRIFALSPNEAIERSRLQKEIWEDDGVIVGRSLDMFISKLRKKLEADPNVKIAVIRGKGYKLKVA
ncbi:winged helix-turn-helix domain-containing protein [Ferruginibacter sp.]